MMTKTKTKSFVNLFFFYWNIYENFLKLLKLHKLLLPEMIWWWWWRWWLLWTWDGLLLDAAAATTAAAFKRVNADVAAAAAFVELLLLLLDAVFVSERWFLNNARWLGGWFNWFRTSATLLIYLFEKNIVYLFFSNYSNKHFKFIYKM